jgi:threonine/homoserine/homoserine lactone efflux protein
MAFWDGLLFGMFLQLSVGPVCIAVLQRAVTQGFRNALRMIAGVALVDAAYMAAAVGGLSLLLQIPWVKGIVLIGGAATLVWFGIGSIRAKSEHGGQEEQSERAEKELKQVL